MKEKEREQKRKFVNMGIEPTTRPIRLNACVFLSLNLLGCGIPPARRQAVARASPSPPRRTRLVPPRTVVFDDPQAVCVDRGRLRVVQVVPMGASVSGEEVTLVS